MKKVFLIALAILLTNCVKSQVSCEIRIEFNKENSLTNGKCHSFGTHGLTVVSSNQVNAKETYWYFDFYDTELNHQETKEVVLGDRMYPKETFEDSTSLYKLYFDRKGNIVIIKANIETNEITVVRNTMHKKLAVENFIVVNDKAFINTYMKKSREFFSIDLNTGVKNNIFIDYDNFDLSDADFTKVQASNNLSELFYFARDYNKKQGSDFYFTYFNKESGSSDIINLSENTENHFTDISGYNAGDDKYIFTGTYSSINTSVSEGLYLCQVKDGEVESLNFYSFIKLNNFLDYLPEKKQKKINKKKKKKEDKGKEYKINYQIACHDIITMEDGYIFLGEAYFPTYTTYTTYVNGTATTHTVFDGYFYTHAVIVKFDFDGNILWDQCFEMYPPYKPFYVKKFISIAENDNESVKLLFAGGAHFYSKEFSNNGDLIKDREVEVMTTLNENDKWKWSSADVEYWYDNYFVAYGRQKIKNKDKDDIVRKRKVFYITKIKFN